MTLTAIYDLQRNPPTYDVVAFLAHAEIERVRRGEPDIDLHILPGPAGGFRKDSLWPYSVEERVKLRENVLVPLCRLLPSVKSVSVDGSRDASGWGKVERHISLPKIMEALREGCRPLRGDPTFGLGFRLSPNRDRDVITFTLREAEHHPLRNSRVEEWVRASEELRERDWRVVVIRDTIKASEGFPGRCVVVDEKAAVDLDVRANLYASAALNVGICNGPMWMSIFMDAPTLMLRPVTNEAKGCYDEAFYRRWGLNRGDQLPTSPPHQRLVWEDDTRDNIVRAVEEMLTCVG